MMAMMFELLAVEAVDAAVVVVVAFMSGGNCGKVTAIKRLIK